MRKTINKLRKIAEKTELNNADRDFLLNDYFGIEEEEYNFVYKQNYSSAVENKGCIIIMSSLSLLLALKNEYITEAEKEKIFNLVLNDNAVYEHQGSERKIIDILFRTNYITLMHHAAYYGNYTIIKKLKDKGLDINKSYTFGGSRAITPLSVAIASGHFKCAKDMISELNTKCLYPLEGDCYKGIFSSTPIEILCRINNKDLTTHEDKKAADALFELVLSKITKEDINNLITHQKGENNIRYSILDIAQQNGIKKEWQDKLKEKGAKNATTILTERYNQQRLKRNWSKTYAWLGIGGSVALFAAGAAIGYGLFSALHHFAQLDFHICVMVFFLYGGVIILPLMVVGMLVAPIGAAVVVGIAAMDLVEQYVEANKEEVAFKEEMELYRS